MESKRRKQTKICKFCHSTFRPLYASKGIYCSVKCVGRDRSGEQHHGWKGDNITYQGIHSWFRNKKDNKCKFCGSNERLELALIEGKEHARDFNNYYTLCVPCHRKYDAHEAWNKGITTIKDIRCERCNTLFKPRRKSARYCSTKCSAQDRPTPVRDRDEQGKFIELNKTKHE